MQFNVYGMSCAACSARVEKAVSQVPGVESCTVSLLTNQMTVEGNVQPAVIAAAVKAAGYKAEPFTAQDADTTDAATAAKQSETKLLRSLLISVAFLLLLMLLCMGGVMLHMPMPTFLEQSPIAIAIIETVLCLAVMIIHRRFFVNGIKGILHRSPNMDTLVSVGSLASFLYSVVIVFLIAKNQYGNQTETASHYLHQLYFDSSAMILVLITVGKLLEAKSKGKTTNALSALIKMSPKTARLMKDGQEIIVPVSEIQVGDCFAVKPGDSIPVDGEVISGESAVDESFLTGESMPVDKNIGCNVFSATQNTSGYLLCKATKVGTNTTHAQIIKLMSDAAATKAPAGRMADRVPSVFVPIVMLLALITSIVWLIISHSMSNALLYGVSVLVVSCPCALGLATPVAIMVGNGVGAKHGILFKTAEALENMGKAQIVVLDKTGTITIGKPTVKELLPYGETTEDNLLTVAAALECTSEHPLARAILAEAENRSIVPKQPEHFEAHSGFGITGVIDGQPACAGKKAFVLESLTQIPSDAYLEKLSADDSTQIWVSQSGVLLGVISVEDAVKPDSMQAVSELQKLCNQTVMLSGDRRETAKKVAHEIGIHSFIPEVLPTQKEEQVRRLKNEAPVLMVGDGINDAPALISADIGCAIGNGTNVAIEAADVVLMNNRLTDVCAGIRLSRKTLQIIRQNLFWALCYNLVGIPLAAGVFVPLLHWRLSPMFCAAMMSLSSIIVVGNALRLNRFAIYDSKHDHLVKAKKKGSKTMEKSFRTEGMMCAHCEAHVKKALESIPGVVSADANHSTGMVTVTMSEPVSEDVLKKAIENEGYKVL